MSTFEDAMSIEGSTGEDEIPLSGYELKAGTTVPPGVRSTGLSEEVSFATFSLSLSQFKSQIVMVLSFVGYWLMLLNWVVITKRKLNKLM